MGSFLPSFRYALRLLLKSPGFTVTAVLILGFGIGVNTAIFSLIDAVMLRPLPYPEPQELAWLFMPTSSSSTTPFDYPDYCDFVAAQHTFDSLSIEVSALFDVSGGRNAERITGAYQTASNFRVEGLPFSLGRPFTEDEDRPGGPLLVVLTERFWQSHFAADPQILGKNLQINGHDFIIVGVVPGEGEDVEPPAFYIPLNAADVIGDWGKWRNRGDHWLQCFGRLKRGVTFQEAQADLATILRELQERYPEDRGYGVRVASLLDSDIRNYAGTLWLLESIAVCLLLISSANVAGLLFTKALDRTREMSIRASLGATRRKLIEQLVSESLLLAVPSGIFGLFVGTVAINLIKTLGPPDLIRLSDVKLDAEALFFCFGLTVVSALLIGLYPAISQSKINLGAALKGQSDRTGTAGPRRQRIQAILVISQVAIACVLIVGAGLLVRSFLVMRSVPMGFNPDQLLTTQISLIADKYDDSKARAFIDKLLESVRRLPGVSGAAVSSGPPFAYNGEGVAFSAESDQHLDLGQAPRLALTIVSPNFFRSLQIPLLEGRDFDSHDDSPDRPVLIIDKRLAERFFPGLSPLGKQIQLGLSSKKKFTIIGIAGTVILDSPDFQEQHPAFVAYLSYREGYAAWEKLIIRAVIPPEVLIPEVRRVAATIDPDVPLDRFDTYEELVDNRFAARRLGMWLVGTVSVVALVLSAVGLYGTLTYAVTQRTREIGIRVALGAPPSAVLWSVVHNAFGLVSVGFALGMVVALGLVRLIQNTLYGVSATDPIALGFTVLILGLAALLACLTPALRAIRINPIVALRE